VTTESDADTQNYARHYTIDKSIIPENFNILSSAVLEIICGQNHFLKNEK
jgi:hypothetical protein